MCVLPKSSLMSGHNLNRRGNIMWLQGQGQCRPVVSLKISWPKWSSLGLGLCQSKGNDALDAIGNEDLWVGQFDTQITLNLHSSNWRSAAGSGMSGQAYHFVLAIDMLGVWTLCSKCRRSGCSHNHWPAHEPVAATLLCVPLPSLLAK